MFRTSTPVSATDFFNREAELARLTACVARLEAGAPQWMAIIGRRKVGKTSLLLELARTVQRDRLRFIATDVLEYVPLDITIVRAYALRVLDECLPAPGGALSVLAQVDPTGYTIALSSHARFQQLGPDTQRLLLSLPTLQLDAAGVRACLDLPEQMAQSLDLHLVAAWDEFQALGQLAGRPKVDLLPVMRSIWQRHRRVAYFISGSERTLLTELVTAEHSPFFQHFEMMELGDIPTAAAHALLASAAPEERAIPKAIRTRMIALLGGHPFYLQLLGDELTRRPTPYDEDALKEATQSLLFSKTGRLALYFEGWFRQLVGRSTGLVAVLRALADGPMRLTDIAQTVGAASGATVRLVDRLGDALEHRPDKRYALVDPVFGLWLRWRAPGGSAVPMTVLGDEAERAAAKTLARLGFDLVFQARASRGAFDLLATQGAYQLGVQVKKATLPIWFAEADWRRMEAEADRLGWQWIVMVEAGEGSVALAPEKAIATPKGMRLTEDARIENLAVWIRG